MNFPTIDQKKTGMKIKAYVRREHLTGSQVTEMLGLSSKSTFYKWLRGDTLPSLDNLYALSLLLRVSINDIIQPSDTDFYSERNLRVKYVCDKGKEYKPKTNQSDLNNSAKSKSS